MKLMTQERLELSRPTLEPSESSLKLLSQKYARQGSNLQPADYSDILARIAGNPLLFPIELRAQLN